MHFALRGKNGLFSQEYLEAISEVHSGIRKHLLLVKNCVFVLKYLRCMLCL